jgi:RNA polymerase sigma-70 factor (ECF subfamily)
VPEPPDHPADDRTDEELIHRARAGDERAFEALYLRHRDWVYRLAWRFTRDHEDSLDIVQETFAYVARKLGSLRLTARLTTFLYPVVRNLALTSRRKHRLRLRARTELGASAARDSGPRAEDPGDLDALLACLSDDHRETVLMRFVDGLTLEEISQATRTPLGTVKSRLHHAVQALRQHPMCLEYFGL